jgi:hypothetical protein
MERCIIVQGPTYDNSINQIKECFNDMPVIYSTWKGYESWYGDGDVAIFSHTPHDAGVKNLNYQKESTIAGLLYAKELGYKRALKWRSDMWTNNAKGLMELMNGELNTLCWVESNGGYLTDFFLEGDISDLLEIWDLNPSGEFPERVLTNRINHLGWMDRVNLIVGDLNENCDIYWNSRHGAYWMHEMNKVPELYKNKIYGR